MENKKNKTPVDDKESDFYYALGHELRREIIKIIGENGHSSFTYLKKTLKVSTGTIYHHLDVLSQLIEQKKNKKYQLTELGQYAYESLINNKKNIGISPIFQFNNKYLNRVFLSYSNIIQPSGKRNYIILLIISVLILILGIILDGLSGYNSFLLFFIRNLNEDLYLFGGFTFIINIFIFFLIVEGLCRLFYKKKANSRLLLISFPLILSPMLVYLGFHYIFLSNELITNNVYYFIDKVLLIGFQVLSLWFLSFHLNILKNLKINSGLTLSLILDLVGFTVIFFTSFQF